MLKFKNRNADNGSFFYFGSGEMDISLFERLSGQSKTVKPTIQAISNAQQLADTEHTVSTSVVAEILKITMKALNDRIRLLRKLDLLAEIPFAFIGKHPAKRRVICLSMIIDEPLLNKANTMISETVTDMSALTKKRENVRRTYRALELSTRPSVANPLPYVMRQSDTFLIEQLAVNGKDPRNSLAKTFYVMAEDGKPHPVVAKIQSFSRILDSDDLQVLFATYTLIYLYHKKAIADHVLNGSTPRNLTPIYVDDILRIQRRALGGESRRSTRESLQAIRDTEYDLYGLTNIRVSNEIVAKYAERRFRNFTQCSALSDHAPEITLKGDNVVFGDNAMIYLVELPDHIFESLLYNKTLFVFPTASLSVPSIIFMLYLRLRSKCRLNYDESLKNLNNAMAPTRRFSDFKKSIVSAMNKLNRFKDPYLFADYRDDENDIIFNLWGYHGRISLKENYLTVKANQKEIIEACGLDSSTQESPTKKNDIYIDFVPLIKVDKILPKNLQRIIQRDITKYTIQYNNPKNKDQSHIITVYSNTLDVSQTIDMLSDAYGLDIAFIEERVKQDIEGISKFVVNDYEITYDDYVTLKLLTNAPNLSGNDFIRAFFRRRTMFNELHSVLALDAEPSKGFCEHVRSYQ